MKRLLLAVVAVAAIGFTATSAQAGGWGGHCHHDRHCHRNYYRPPAYCGPYAYAPPVVYQPYAYYPPQNTFFYQGRNVGVRFGW
jgi:hypothetical protein